MEIVQFDKSLFDQVQRIYGEGIATGIATFETSIPDWDSWDSAHLNIGRLATMNGDKMLGWASLSGVTNRCVHQGVAEISIYVAAESRGKGVGKLLLQKLIDVSEENKIWTLQAGIFRENTASQILHKKCGFREIGYREKIGQLNGVWKDNVLMERRSIVVGN